MHSRGRFLVVVVLLASVVAACRAPSDEPAAKPSVASSSETVPTPAPTTPAPSAPAPVTTSNDIAVPAATKTSNGSVATLPATRTKQFSLLGVTWDRGADDASVTAQVRVRANGVWSGWETLEVDADSDGAGRAGTEPWWVDSADEVAARVITASGAAASNVKVVTIDPGTQAASEGTTSPAFYSTTSSSVVTTIADGKPSFMGAPGIISRAAWGAYTPGNCSTPPTYPQYGTTVQGIVLHHTAGSNTYSKKQSASIVRAIQKYHMNGRGWCDIAYNFLVDKYGQIFEGRAGGIDRPVRGSHAGDSIVNEQTMGVALMGNLDKKKPSTKMKNATVKLVGWRLATTFTPAKGKVVIGNKYLNIISGHRNIVGTACPGKYGYAWLGAKGGLRDRVASYISHFNSSIKIVQASFPVETKGVVVVGEFGNASFHRAIFSKLDFYWRPSTGVVTVAGAIRDAYVAQGSEGGALGFPAGWASAPDADGVIVQQFDHGALSFDTDEPGAVAHLVVAPAAQPPTQTPETTPTPSETTPSPTASPTWFGRFGGVAGSEILPA